MSPNNNYSESSTISAPKQHLAGGAIGAMRDAFKPIAEKVGEALCVYAVPEEKLSKVVDHAIGLQCKNPSWRAGKVARKTAEHFKLKPLSDATH
jgi:hypothetical protein